MNAVLCLPIVSLFFLVICEASNVLVDGLKSVSVCEIFPADIDAFEYLPIGFREL